jgi:predicted Rdx family selenoprotein
MIPGSGGVFTVVVDGKKVFSKDDLYRFPEAGELAGLIAKARGK